MTTARNEKQTTFTTNHQPDSSIGIQGKQPSLNEAEFDLVLTNVLGSPISTIVRPPQSQRRAGSHRRNDNLSILRRELRKTERERYPHSICKRKQVLIDGKRKSVLYVQEHQPIDANALDKIKAAAIKERKINLVAGVIHAMKSSPNYFNLTSEQKIQIENQLMALIYKKENEKAKEKSPTEIMDKFINEMTNTIASESGLKGDEIIRKIRNAERYFVAKNNANKMLVFQHNTNDTNYYQVDVPLNHQFGYSDKQKQAFLNIRTSNQPAWFTKLPKWEQESLLKLIPEDIKGDWNRFAQFSSMQHIPGLKNDRVNHLVSISKNGSINVISNSIKTGTIVPYEMGMESPDTIATANDTAEQLLSALEDKAKGNFNKKWEGVNFTKEPPKPLVLVQSILSDVKVLGGPDNKLTEKQEEAIGNNINKFNDIKIITGNEPVNFLRGFARQKSRWVYAKEVMKYAKEFLKSLPKDNQLNEEQQTSKKIINSALEDLKGLKKGRSKRYLMKGRNYEAFKVAYLATLVEAMGGAVSTNCKSGKDRTGLDELYRHAMRIYFEQYKKLPGYFDKGQDRKNFIVIYAQLFNTMKIQQKAGENTPGSFGIKDDAMMLCPDIASYLGDSYNYSNQVSAINKPKKTFMEDEAKQSKELNKETKNKEAQTLQKEIKGELRQVHKNNIEEKYSENVFFKNSIFEKLKILKADFKTKTVKWNWNSFFKFGSQESKKDKKKTAPKPLTISTH